MSSPALTLVARVVGHLTQAMPATSTSRCAR